MRRPGSGLVPRSHAPFATTLVLLSAVTMSASAVAGGGLRVDFDHPAIAGTSTSLIVELAPDCCAPPNCAWLAARGSGRIRWGDLADSQDAWSWHESVPDVGSFPPAAQLRIEKQHVFDKPGRYAVDVEYTWEFETDPGCEPTRGYQRQRLAVDVYPQPSLPVSGGIGIYFDREGTRCSGPVEAGTILYVLATLVGEEPMNASGADFRVGVSDPDAVQLYAASDPAWISIGNALRDGITLARSCDPDSIQNPVLLLTLRVFPVRSDFRDVRLFVERSHKPSNPSYADAMIVLCNEPSFTPIRAGAGFSAVLNPSTPGRGLCGYAAPGRASARPDELTR